MDIDVLEKYEAAVRKLYANKITNIDNVNNLLGVYAYEKFVGDKVMYFLKAGLSIDDVEKIVVKKREKQRVFMENKKIEERKKSSVEKNEASFMFLIKELYK